MSTVEFIKEKLTKELEAEHCEVQNLGDCSGGKFAVLVVSEKFEGKKLLERQRLVNDLFKEELASNSIHALQQKTKTPAEWAKLSQNNQ